MRQKGLTEVRKKGLTEVRKNVKPNGPVDMGRGGSNLHQFQEQLHGVMEELTTLGGSEAHGHRRRESRRQPLLQHRQLRKHHRWNPEKQRIRSSPHMWNGLQATDQFMRNKTPGGIGMVGVLQDGEPSLRGLRRAGQQGQKRW